MSLKLLTCFACSAAFLLDACSGNNPTGTSGTSGRGSETPDESGSAQTPGLAKANDEFMNASKAVDDAIKAVDDAIRARRGRAGARELIDKALDALDAAVRAADSAVIAAEDGSAADLGRAARARIRANNFRIEQEKRLYDARASLVWFVWFGENLVRQQIARGSVLVPRDGINTADITRTPRTIPTSATDKTPKVNPDAFTSTMFKDVMYSAGDTVFSNSGDEFRVDGYVGQRASGTVVIDITIYTGLRLTDAGLVMRTGGTDTTDYDGYSSYRGDFTDMRKDITNSVSDTNGDAFVDFDDGLRGQNGWDLTIALDEPQTTPFPANSDDISDRVSSWTGNNAFYWRSLVPADDSQKSDGEHYVENAFSDQPPGQENLGMYELWLSNHVGIADRGLEPAVPGTTVTCPDGSRGTSCPRDDVHLYLKYAAYGLFVYTADTQTFLDTSFDMNGQIGRINTISFGYSAFGTEDGQKITDIGEAIAGGTFSGYSLAYEVKGDQLNLPIETKLLRSDVTLTVNIPKGSGSATLRGTMSNFQRWNDVLYLWTAYTDNFSVALNSATIADDGTFNGTASATPANVGSFRLNADGAGVYKGNFYGPRSDKDDLEIAGSFAIGQSSSGSASSRELYGSFGAKQNPSVR